MGIMAQTIEMSAIEQIPPDVRVCHIDELDWPAKKHLAEFEEDEPIEIDNRIAEAFECCDVVKYTDYYEVSLC